MQTDASHLEQLDETELVRAVQRGQTGAFSPLVQCHLAPVHAFVALKLPVPHLVDDITHETFVFAYQNIHKFTPGTSLRAWLRAIAGNLVRAEIERYLREQSNHLGYLEHRLTESELARPDSLTSREADFLQECLEAVPGPMRELLASKYAEGCSTEEIAQRLRRSLAWVRTTLFRLRQQLKNCVEEKLRREPT